MRCLQRLASFMAITALLIPVTLPQVVLSAPASETSSLSASASAVFNERYGVTSSHLSQYDDPTMHGDFQAMNGAQAGWVRCSFAWHVMEPFQGIWIYGGTDRVAAEAATHNVKIMGTLGGCPYWANGDKAWMFPPIDTPEHMLAWRNYVKEVCTRYKGKVAAWELWNEENIKEFWGYVPAAAAYMPLLIAASQEIRAADPGAIVVMGGLAGGLSFTYFEDCLKLGLADYVDAVAYHPYAETLGTGEYTPQESTCRLIVQYMRYLISFYSTKNPQIWITEFGWSTRPVSPPGVSLDTQASYMLRSFINYAGTEVSRIFWYMLRDEEVEQDGLLKNDFTNKPSYYYYRTFQDVFGKATSTAPGAVSFACTQQSTLEAHSFLTGSGSLAFAAWKSDDSSDNLSLTIANTSYNRLVAVDPLTGQRSNLSGVSRDAQGKLTVSGVAIGKRPVIIEADTAPAHTVTASVSGGNGNVSPASQSVVEGGTATVNITPDPGYRVASITDNGTGAAVSNPYVIGNLTGAHNIVVTFGPEIPGTAFYFAEGYTGSGFEEWLCLMNPATSPTTAHITYMFSDGSTTRKDVSIGATTRETVFVNEVVGPDRNVSVKVEADSPIVAERPMYFNYKDKWNGGHDVVGYVP